MKKMIIPVLFFVLFFLGCSNPTSSDPSPAPTQPNPAPIEDNEVTVSFDCQGGSAVSSLKVEPGSTVETLPVSEKFTYHFDGWFTAVNGGGTKFLADTVVKEDITLYASWAQTAVVTTLTTSLSDPSGITTDEAGNLYVADRGNHLIRKISPEGTVTTLAGSGKPGKEDGDGTAASFNTPFDVAVDSEGTVYVADFTNNLIRKITHAGAVTTLTESSGTAATFGGPKVAVDSAGTVYVADAGKNLIRKITPSGVITTLAGSGKPGKADGTGTEASFEGLSGITVDSAGTVYVTDSTNKLIRKITADGIVTTLAGTAASFSVPLGIAVDSAGNVYVADFWDQLIRKITPAGVVTTLAGSGKLGKDDGTGTAASFHGPIGVAVDSKGTVYVADSANHSIRKITQ